MEMLVNILGELLMFCLYFLAAGLLVFTLYYLYCLLIILYALADVVYEAMKRAWAWFK